MPGSAALMVGYSFSDVIAYLSYPPPASSDPFIGGYSTVAITMVCQPIKTLYVGGRNFNMAYFSGESSMPQMKEYAATTVGV